LGNEYTNFLRNANSQADMDDLLNDLDTMEMSGVQRSAARIRYRKKKYN
jgi:hypothetical protein